MSPEETARQRIDAMLTASGWAIQNYKALNLSAGRGIVVREVPLKTGPCDYLLLIDRKPVGIVEAKRKGTTLSTVADQSGRYAAGLPVFLAEGLTGPLPFLYESTGVETFFRDDRDPEPRSRRVFSFHARKRSQRGWPNRTPFAPVSQKCPSRIRSPRRVCARVRSKLVRSSTSRLPPI